MNIIDLLKKQHMTTREALEELEKADEIDPMEVRLLADELVAHMMIEEQFFYPRVRQLAGDLIMESFEEHAVARFELARVLIAKGEEQKARIKVLKELVLQHIREEETQLLPKVQRAIGGAELENLGRRLEPTFETAVELGFEKLVVSNGTGPELRRQADGGARAQQKQTRRGTQRRTQASVQARKQQQARGGGRRPHA